MKDTRWFSLSVKMMSLLLVLGLTAFALGCQTPTTKKEKVSTAAGPNLVLELPREGETVTGPNVMVRVKVKNLKLEPPGLVKQAGVGHIHYYLDDKVQMSAEQTFTFTGVTSGEHIVRIVLVQKDHTPFSPSVEKKVKINVASGAETGGSANPPSPPGQ